jgi:hypothetical protein
MTKRNGQERGRRNRKRAPAGFISQHEQAARLGVTIRTLERWRKEHFGPPYCRAGKTVYYRDGSGEEWLRDNEKNPALVRP